MAWSEQGGKTRRSVLSVVVALLAITLLHYLTNARLLTYHSIYRSLSYLPIIVAAVLGGLRGGIVRHAVQEPLIGSDPVWSRCVEQARALTALDLDIVCSGEAGAGKTVLAHLAHGSSDRQAAPLVAIDFRTIRPPIQRAVLLGEAGREGAWSQAGAGTLLLAHVDHCGQDGWTALREALVRRTGKHGPCLLLTACSGALPADLILPKFAFRHCGTAARIFRYSPVRLRMEPISRWPLWNS